MTIEAHIEATARVCHEANRAWCVANGDHSQPTWDDAPDWQRDSALIGVKGALSGNTPEQSHESWTAVKVADGWVYGEVKDPDAKTHPCLVPYDELPPEQRVKDALFVAIVRALGDRPHETDGAPCWCDPKVETVYRDDGEIAGTVVVHNSADGREHGEADHDRKACATCQDATR